MKWKGIVLVAYFTFLYKINADSVDSSASCTATPGSTLINEGGSNKTYICAAPRNGVGPHKTFPSRCVLATYNCQHKSAPYIYRHDGPCNNTPDDACKHICLPMDKYVCGGPINGNGDNITFASVCELQNYNCDNTDSKYRVINEGACEDVECHRPCPKDENPVCAAPLDRRSDETKSFKNPCHMENYNCENRGNEYEVIGAGPCPARVTNPTFPPAAAQCGSCPNDDHPICGKSPAHEAGKSFKNRCEMIRFNCVHNSHYTYKHDGKCVQSCATTCPEVTQPVCAASLRGHVPPRTFRNKCVLDLHNCEADISNSDDIFEFLYPRECQTTDRTSTPRSPTASCHKICARKFIPICASSNRNSNVRHTFHNRCEMENYSCLYPQDSYSYYHEGRCEQHAPPSERLCRVQLCRQEAEAPICAIPQNGVGPNLDFSGNCSLQNYNCLHKSTQYIFYHNNHCRNVVPPSGNIVSCKKICSSLESPICGVSRHFKSKMTFKNLCEMDNYNCDHAILGTYEFSHAGKCDIETAPTPPIMIEPECQKSCTDSYEPLCAIPSFGLKIQRTFHNPCIFDKYNCEHFLIKYEAIHAGECRTTEILPPLPLPSPPSLPIIEDKCLRIRCSHEYKPICSRSRSQSNLQKTFSSSCLMDFYNCEHESDQFEFLHHGVCKSPILPAPAPGISCIKDCECTRRPVCAKSRFGQMRQTFTNQCKLDNYNCEHYTDPYDVIHEGECAITPNPLPAPSRSCKRDCECDYKPVCASPRSRFGPRLTFTNRCKLDNHNCETSGDDQYDFEHEGPCPQFEKIIEAPTNPPNIHVGAIRECFRECNKDYQPVCAKLRDNLGLVQLTKTFHNRCEFENHNCVFTLSRYELLHGGECPDDRRS